MIITMIAVLIRMIKVGYMSLHTKYVVIEEKWGNGSY